MEEQDIDYSIPRNDSKVYQKRPSEDYGDDISKFCFTEYYFIQHIKEVIKNMEYFIKKGENFIHKHRKLFKSKGYK